MARDYGKIFDIEGREFVTSRGAWLATVREYPAARGVDDALLHLRVNFELQGGQLARSLDLWIVSAPNVTLMAESIGMLEAMKRWLEDSAGNDELLYDSEIKDLVPLQKRYQPRT